MILAAGDFPRKHGEARKILENVHRVIACDSAALKYRRVFKRWPEVIIGDMDSVGKEIREKREEIRCGVVKIPEQETNDLEKAIRYCLERDWKNLVIVGATGKREDHTIGNIYRAMKYGIKIVTDYGVFYPILGTLSMSVHKGAELSIFASDPKAKMSAHGLVWPLDGVKFSSPYVATLNRAASTRISITSSSPAYLYLHS